MANSSKSSTFAIDASPKAPEPETKTVDPKEKPFDSVAYVAEARKDSYWRVSLQKTRADHPELSPFMDRPRVFRCEKHQAMDLFNRHYSIRSTIHRYVIEPATFEDFALQAKDDIRRMELMQLKPGPSEGLRAIAATVITEKPKPTAA